MGATIIRLDGLTKYYRKQRGIEDLSFSVEEGEIFGFIGPNGAGKSTTLRLLMGLLAADRGRGEIFGLDCRRDAPRIARDVGYIPALASYYGELRVRELLEYTSRIYGLDTRERMLELSERLHLDLSRRILDLSLGNRKKVGIVNALLTSPRLLLMDEPTSGLDPLIQQAFIQILREENERGTTIFLSSHVLGEVQRLCSRVGILREGRLIDIQDIQDMRKSGYKKVDLTCAGPVPSQRLKVPGIADCLITGERASFLYRGSVESLMELLGGLRLTDILIGEPSLEEIFLHYYE